MKKKYIISHRLADTSIDKDEAHECVHHAWQKGLAQGCELHSESLSSHGRKAMTFYANPDELEKKMSELKKSMGMKAKSLIVEQEISLDRHDPVYSLIKKKFSATNKMSVMAAQATPVAKKEPDILTLHVTGNDKPLHNATVSLVSINRSGAPVTRSATSDKKGMASFIVDADSGKPVMYYIVPQSGYWGMTALNPVGSMKVDCPPLPRNGPLGWWHHEVGVNSFDLNSGEGITVGVIDTGVGPNPCLDNIKDAGAIIGQKWTKNGADVGNHGSVVCGIIGARPQKTGEYGGIAPAAQVTSMRVYPDAESSANQLDVSLAIDILSKSEKADLINLSLYSSKPSSIQEDAIKTALAQGTLCLCAAGNSSGPVGWPAAFSECVAISALGKLGVVPDNVVDGQFVPTKKARHGDDGIYIAKFSSFGKKLTVGAPGVGIIGPVPQVSGNDFNFISESGTSEATPLTAGILARLLSRSKEYRQLPRNEERVKLAKEILMKYVVENGLQPLYTGAGLPFWKN